MLADREHVESDLVRLARDPHDRLDPLRLARRPACDRVPRHVTHREDPELHRLSLSRRLHDCASKRRRVCTYSAHHYLWQPSGGACQATGGQLPSALTASRRTANGGLTDKKHHSLRRCSYPEPMIASTRERRSSITGSFG